MKKLILVIALFAFAFAGPAFAKPNKSAVISIVRVDRIKGNLAAGQSTTITATIIDGGRTAHGVDVAIQLIDSNGNVASSQNYSHQTLPEDTFENYVLNTDALDSGSYTIELFVSNSNGTLLTAFRNLGTIVVQ